MLQYTHDEINALSDAIFTIMKFSVKYGVGVSIYPQSSRASFLTFESFNNGMRICNGIVPDAIEMTSCPDRIMTRLCDDMLTRLEQCKE